MAMTDEEAEKLKAELASTKEQLHSLLTKAKADDNAAKEAEAKRSKEKPGKLELDPDVVKEIAELKGKVAELEKSLGKRAGGSNAEFFNLFGSK